MGTAPGNVFQSRGERAMNVEQQPLVTVITPVYNTEKYLAECIESVLAQTYDNWEYVIVNNCSTDQTLEIAERYARQDARIRIHDNDEFLSMMPNWNHAMRQIGPQSKYCKVVHADDWLFPDCLEKMVSLAEAHPTVGIVSAYRLDEDQINLDGLPYPSTLVSGKELARSFLLRGGPHVFGSPTSTLLRADLVRAQDPFYNEQNIHADQETCIDLLQRSDFGFVHQVLTFTRRHNEAATTTTRRFETHRLGYLKILKRFGPVFLNEQEFKRRWQRVIKHYYRFLSIRVIEGKEKAYWEYQRAEMANLGHPMSRLKLAIAVGLRLLDIHSAVKLYRKSRQRKRSQAQTAYAEHQNMGCDRLRGIISAPGQEKGPHQE
jgi:glycosyltransferase involved in cell wall biosynthesis